MKIIKEDLREKGSKGNEYVNRVEYNKVDRADNHVR